ncbi:hypothetical protein BS17DRAFT_790826, partial [Gyrodon lividus]
MSSYLTNVFWGSGPSTAKPKNLRPSTPKLTTPTPHHHDTQWEHIKSASTVSPDADEATFERLGDSQVDETNPQRVIVQLQKDIEQLTRQLDDVAAAKLKVEAERDGLSKKVKELRSSGRSERDRDRAGSSTKAGREREREKERVSTIAIATTDAVKEENDKLKNMLYRQAQQLEHATDEIKRERSQLRS